MLGLGMGVVAYLTWTFRYFSNVLQHKHVTDLKHFCKLSLYDIILNKNNTQMVWKVSFIPVSWRENNSVRLNLLHLDVSSF